jgi:hypothetical protein
MLLISSESNLAFYFSVIASRHTLRMNYNHGTGMSLVCGKTMESAGKHNNGCIYW